MIHGFPHTTTWTLAKVQFSEPAFCSELPISTVGSDLLPHRIRFSARWEKQGGMSNRVSQCFTVTVKLHPSRIMIIDLGNRCRKRKTWHDSREAPRKHGAARMP